MALVRNAANTLRKGRIGETSYYTSKGRQIARQALNNSNYGESARRSIGQQTRRVKWANLVNFYKLCSDWMPKAFENKKPGQTDYNKFMQLNVNAQSVALTRDMAVNGGCAPDNFVISQGTLTPITGNTVPPGPQLLITTTLQESALADITVGAFSADIIAQNNFLAEGMQLSIVRATVSLDGNNIPRTRVEFFEVILDSNNSQALSNFMPATLFAVYEGKLAIVIGSAGIGVAAGILSQITETGLKVSTETLKGDPTITANLSTPEAVAAAIATYGLDKEVILNPDSAEPIV